MFFCVGERTCNTEIKDANSGLRLSKSKIEDLDLTCNKFYSEHIKNVDGKTIASIEHIRTDPIMHVNPRTERGRRMMGNQVNMAQPGTQVVVGRQNKISYDARFLIKDKDQRLVYVVNPLDRYDEIASHVSYGCQGSWTNTGNGNGNNSHRTNKIFNIHLMKYANTTLTSDQYSIAQIVGQFISDEVKADGSGTQNSLTFPVTANWEERLTLLHFALTQEMFMGRQRYFGYLWITMAVLFFAFPLLVVWLPYYLSSSYDYDGY